LNEPVTSLAEFLIGILNRKFCRHYCDFCCCRSSGMTSSCGTMVALDEYGFL
ncbi:hypothetical protein NDU88_005912, partial [Pleurodeles waltl]